jgi:nitrate/TMAO reductase-like tetraheme cytochrome c subunit
MRMNPEVPTPQSRRPSLLRNWLSLTGVVVVIGSLFSTLLLFILDTMAKGSNPYIGILTYFVAPFFFLTGTMLTLVGIWREKRKLGRIAGAIWPRMVVDLSRPRDRKMMVFFLAGAVLFLLLSAVGSYHTYHFTESVTFCGEACHTVMKPELVTYQHGSHARVACTECHIGSGAKWFVKAKVSGSYQLYAVAFDKYPRPVPTPIKNLRPAQDTCEQCHWPQKFVGNLERTIDYHLPDETNTPFSVRMLMKVGGSNPSHGPVGGIHWHTSAEHKTQYIAAKLEDGRWIPDETRQSIPWVRTVNDQGVANEFRKKSFTNDIAGFEVRTMDCMDCHNRPAHRYQTPNEAVDLAMSLGGIDTGLHWIKSNAVAALTQSYTNEPQALQAIATTLSEKYPNEPRVRPAIEAVQKIYSENFFPEMNASWKAYPDNIGHMEWPGCFRCHDGLHKTADNKRAIKASNCNACHTLLAQGSGADLEKLNPGGMKFTHPGDELDENSTCNECHTGGL